MIIYIKLDLLPINKKKDSEVKLLLNKTASTSAACLRLVFSHTPPCLVRHTYSNLRGKLSLTIGLKTEKMHLITVLPCLHPGSQLARVMCKWRGTLFWKVVLGDNSILGTAPNRVIKL